MKRAKLILGLIAILFFASCQKSNKDESGIKAENSSDSYISSSAAVENGKDTTRKFIRTADLKFKVKNVVKSTYEIENITGNMGGFVTFTNLTSEINYVNQTAISADSSLETTYYTVSNTITLRVPNTKLDATLKQISEKVDFLDYRIIKTEDVALQMLSNRLTQERSSKNELRITNAINNRGKKLKETTTAEELLLSKQEESDNSKISNLSLEDQIDFSTINLSIYQRPSFRRELIANDKNIDAYEPRLGAKFIEAVTDGWSILEAIVLFLARLWALFLLGILVFLGYKRFGFKLKGRNL